MIRRSSLIAGKGRESTGIVVRAFVLALLSLAGMDAFALDPNRLPMQYVQRAWQIQQGLPQNSVTAIAQTADGYLWVGTWSGLARFDGSRFTVFDTQTVPEMRDLFISSLVVRRSGELWIGTLSGVLIYENGRFRALPLGLPNQSVHAMVEDANGTMWIALRDGRIGRFDGKRFTLLKAELGSARLWALCVTSTATWVATASGLRRIRGETIDSFADSLGNVVVYALFRDADRMLIGTERGLFVFDGHRLSLAHPELAHDIVTAVTRDREGSVWIGTRNNGLKRWRDGRVTGVKLIEQASGDVVDALFEDRDGNLWVGTSEGGLKQLADGGIIAFRTQDGLSSDSVWTMAAGPDGNIWVGTEKGLDRFDGQSWTSVPLPRRNIAITALLPERAGVWVGTNGAGLLHVTDRGTKIHFPTGHIWALFRDRSGVLWAGATDGLLELDGEHWTKHTKAGGLPYDDIGAILEDRRGRLWLATANGLFFREGERFATRIGSTDLPRETTWSIYEDSHGDLWFAAHTGLYRVRGEELVYFNARRGLVPGDVGQMVESPRDVFWLSTLKGIARIERRRFEEAARGAARIDLSLFGTTDGMPQNAECTFGSIPVVRDGNVWFTTTRGVAVLDPRVPRWTAAIPLHEEVIVDSVRRSPAESFALGPKTRRIEFHYTSPTFRSPERIRFRYRLEGFDPDWVDVAARRVAYYTNLPAGRYRFLVEAAGADGRWIRAATVILFEVLPPFYLRVWFLVLCVGVTLIVIWLLHTYRMRLLALRHRAVLGERLRIARELHDTVAQRLSGLSLQLDVALQMIPPEVVPDAREQIVSARHTAARGLADTRDALFRLRSDTAETSALPSALERMAAELTAQSLVRAEVSIIGSVRRLGDEVESELLRIAQEAIANALRHAAATRIGVVLEISPRAVRLTVSDDGRGSGPVRLDDLAAMKFGVVGMRERAEKIGGRFAVRSDPGSGTEISVEVRV